MRRDGEEKKREGEVRKEVEKEERRRRRGTVAREEMRRRWKQGRGGEGEDGRK